MKDAGSKLQLRRRRVGNTHYKLRLGLLKSGKTRVVVRKSLNNIVIQFINYSSEGDKVLMTISSKQLVKLGWKAHTGNIPTAYLTGLLAAKNAKNVGESILDVGLSGLTKGCALYAILQGLVDGGLKISHSKEVLLPEERISGKHIENYAKTLKGTPEYDKQFSLYKKNGFNPEEMSKHFNEIKQKILKQ